MSDERTLRPSVVSIVEAISALTMPEGVELVGALENRLGVSAVPWVPPTGHVVLSNPPHTTNPPAPPVLSLWLDAPGPNRKFLLMLLRRRLGLALERAIAVVDALPGRLEGVSLLPAEADEWLADLKRAGVAARIVVVDARG